MLEIIFLKIIEVFCTLVNWKLKSEAIEAIGLFDRKTTTVQCRMIMMLIVSEQQSLQNLELIPNLEKGAQKLTNKHFW